MRVAAESDHRARVAGDRLDELDVGAGRDKARDARMAEVVEAIARFRKPGPFEGRTPDAAVEVRLVERRSAPCRKDQLVGRVAAALERAGCRLLERGPDRGKERDRAGSGLRLRSLDLSPRVGALDADEAPFAIEVGNPSLCHSNCTVVKQLLGKVEAQTQGSNSIQSAWIEATWANEGQWPIALFNGTLTAITGPDLRTGEYYTFRVRHNGSGGSAGEVLAEWYDGSWHVIAAYDGVWCMDSGGGGNCRAAHGTSVYAENDGWFNTGGATDGPGLNHKNIQLRKSSGAWKVFNTTNFSEGGSGAQAPYSKCNFAKWYKFRTPKGDCGTGPST
jgi:hypothetical protein